MTTIAKLDFDIPGAILMLLHLKNYVIRYKKYIWERDEWFVISYFVHKAGLLT